jgi:hypothetical protein
MGGVEKEGKRFFFGKKKQKTFWSWVPGGVTRMGSRARVFLLLFLQKKKALLYFYRSWCVGDGRRDSVLDKQKRTIRDA